MALTPENQSFENEWLQVAKEICRRILELPEIQNMRETLKAAGFLTVEQKSTFVGIANKVKYDVIYEKYGKPGTNTFEQFNARWKCWFNDKDGDTVSHWGKRLTNEEHIIFGSTPDPEEFLK